MKISLGMIIRLLLALLLIGAFVGVYYFFGQDARPKVGVESSGEKLLSAPSVSPTEQKQEVIQEDEEVEEVYVKAGNASRITGQPCAQASERSLAIVYSGDVETRPYFAGITAASFVVEMDHRYTHGGTRVMGVFDCERPQFVGPMRSGRVDFVNVASAFDAIYVPWGGDSTSKSLLKKGVVDHIDCNGEVYPGGNAQSCFRRSTRDVPLAGEDRAFSSAVGLLQQAKTLGYRTSNNFGGYEHQGDAPLAKRPLTGDLSINLQQGFRVRYQYDRESNAYERFFEGREEYDANIRKRVAPKNVIVIRAEKGTFYANGSYLARGLINPWDGIDAQQRDSASGAYPNFALGDPWFDTNFGGPATFYMDGEAFEGSWKKQKSASAQFDFYHTNGEKIRFVPGQIWLHVIDVDRSATWKSL